MHVLRRPFEVTFVNCRPAAVTDLPGIWAIIGPSPGTDSIAATQNILLYELN